MKTPAIILISRFQSQMDLPSNRPVPRNTLTKRPRGGAQKSCPFATFHTLIFTRISCPNLQSLAVRK